MKLRLSIVLACAVSLAATTPGFSAKPEEDLRTTFTKFIAAQNAHDLKALEPLLLDSPDFLWITRGVPVWGRAEAMKRFEILFQGTWHLEPDPEVFRIVQLHADMAHVFVPVVFTIGAPGQQARQALIYVNQTLVRVGGVWRIASILPVSVPTPRE
jgi:hypothetical protein